MRILGALFWILGIGIWYCWPGREPMSFTISFDFMIGAVLFLGILLSLAGAILTMKRVAELERRHAATEQYLDDLAEAWISDGGEFPDGGGEPVHVSMEPLSRDNVVKLVRGRGK